MPELIRPIDEFKYYLEEHTDYSWIDFGNGLLVVFTDDSVNVRQYHDGYCLSSWVEKKEFYSALNDIPAKRELKLTKGDSNNE